MIILAVVCFYGIRVSPGGHDDYMSRAQTDSIKGIFAIIILYSHMRGYLPPPQVVMINYTIGPLISWDNLW